jgi:hypothetical protein
MPENVQNKPLNPSDLSSTLRQKALSAFATLPSSIEDSVAIPSFFVNLAGVMHRHTRSLLQHHNSANRQFVGISRHFIQFG